MKLISAMADSKLFPSFLSRQLSNQTRIYALLVGQFIGIIFVAFAVLDEHTVVLWPNLVAFCAFGTYVMQLLGFINMRMKLSHFSKQYTSPFGIAGACVTIIVFSVGIVSCLWFHAGQIEIVAGYICLASGYYYFFARHQQIFSEAEHAVMLPAHAEIRNANGKPANSNFIDSDCEANFHVLPL
jgi:ethanolamine permease